MLEKSYVKKLIAMVVVFSLVSGQFAGPPKAKAATVWSTTLADTLMRRYPDPDNYPWKSWSYPQAFMLWGMEKLWQSTGDAKYYNYILKYADEHVDSSGNIIGFNGGSMDDMMPGSILVWAYQQTGLSKYKTASTKVRNAFTNYPRTSDGGFWHGKGLQGELWIDGVFMGQMFLTKYGKYIGDSTYAFDEAAKQLYLMEYHLKKGNSGLLYHAWDEDKSASWANKTTGLSPEVWSEGLGWYALMLVETLDVFPSDHPKRAQIEAQLQRLLAGLKNTQDPNTGLWYDVVDKGYLSDNWHDTSGSSMFVYAIKRAIELGLADPAVYGPIAEKGYQGIITKAKINSQGLVDIYDACDGVSVQNSYSAYVNYPKKVNAKEAVAAFLWATWIMEKPGPPPPATTYQAEDAYIYHGVVESNHAGYTGTGFVNYNNEVGSYIEWAVNSASAGTKTLIFRFANGGTANRPMEIRVNGTVVNGSLAFNPTANWDTWNTQSLNVALNAGSNTIRATATTADGGPNVDKLDITGESITPSPSPPPTRTLTPTTTPTQPPGNNIYQAEAASFGGGVTIDSNNTGFLGTGYANFPLSGGFLQFNSADGGTGGNATLRIRYALGVTASRTGLLIVNGTSQNITFNPTGAWTAWTIQDVTVPLNSGTTNTIRFEPNGQDLANIDQIEIILSGGPTNTPTPTRTPTITPTQPPGPIAVEAEAATLSGAARLASCSACSGGQKVGYIGNGSANYVTLTVNVPTSGSYQMTIYGMVNGTRSFSVSINGGTGQTVSFTGTSFDTPITQVIIVSLNAGSNTIKFYNNSAYAPDLDRIVIQ